MNEMLFDKYVADAKLQPQFKLTQERVLLYPWLDIVGKQAIPCAIYAASLRHDKLTRTIVVCYRETAEGSDYTFWCADAFLEGRPGMPLDAAARSSAAAKAVGNPRGLASLLQNSAGTYPSSANPESFCDFWTKWRMKRTVCTHVSHVLAHLRDSQLDFKAELKRCYQVLPDCVTA